AEVTRFLATSASGTMAYAALLDVDGRTRAAAPAGPPLAVDQLGATWGEALAGRPGRTDAFRRDGRVVSATLVPVGAPAPWGVLAAVEDALDSPRQSYLAQLGSQNGEPGGLALADARGVAVASWDPARLGTVVVPAATIARLPLGDPVALSGGVAGTDAVTAIGSRTTGGHAVLFEQRSDLLFGDLRDAQHRRDLTLLAVLSGTLAALAGLHLVRQRAARRAEGRLRAVVENSHDLVLITGTAGVVTYVSPAVEHLLGRSPASCAGAPLDGLCHPADLARLRGLLAEPASGPVLA